MANEKYEILSLKEASEFLKLSMSCVYKLTSQKQIPHYIPGGKRIYFKKSDLENWVFSNRINSDAEMSCEFENYLSRKSKIN